MASVADTAAPWADSDDPVSPELALVDPDLARRLRSREAARPASPVRPPGTSSLLPVLAFQREVRSTAEPAPDPDAVRAAFHAPPRPDPDAPAPAHASAAHAAPREGVEAPRRDTGHAVVQRPFWVRAARAVAVCGVTFAAVFAIVAVGAYVYERAAAPAAGSAADLPAPTPPSSTSGAIEPVPLSWPGVEGVAAYRFELFRGETRVLVARTTAPAYVVPTTWTSGGGRARLEAGLYRWRVWTLDAAGRADDAPMIESQLRVG